MLVLSRKTREAVVVGGGCDLRGLLKVTVLEIAAGKVKLGFEVDAAIPVHRLEIWERMNAKGELHSRAIHPGTDERPVGLNE
jgi:carbon storage regulator CsrA